MNAQDAPKTAPDAPPRLTLGIEAKTINIRTVAVLFARHDSIYKTLPGADVYDSTRDARTWPGGQPVIAHPPCRAWSRLRGLANPDPGEKELAIFAIQQVRVYGGILEHPASSTLWKETDLPRPGRTDAFGGFTLPIYQSWFDHKAEKPTYLYIAGCQLDELPALPLVLGTASHVCGSSGRRRDGGRLHKGDLGWRPEITKAEREHTPPPIGTLVDGGCKIVRLT